MVPGATWAKERRQRWERGRETEDGVSCTVTSVYVTMHTYKLYTAVKGARRTDDQQAGHVLG